MDLRLDAGIVGDAKSVLHMREAAAHRLTEDLGFGAWSGTSRAASIRERLKLGDPLDVSCSTIFIARQGDRAVGSLVLSRFPPGFWKKSLWAEPQALGMGVLGLVVLPELQGHGIGKFLMRETEILAGKLGLPFVRLDAFALDPHSNAFYQKIGYDRRGEVAIRGTELVMYERRVHQGR